MKLYDRREYKIFEDNSGVEPIGETDAAFDCDDVLKFSGELWDVRILGKDYAVIAPMGLTELNEEPEEAYGERECTCPYCGTTMQSCEVTEDYEDDFECPICKSIFKYEREVVFNIEPVRPNTDIKEI